MIDLLINYLKNNLREILYATVTYLISIGIFFYYPIIIGWSGRSLGDTTTIQVIFVAMFAFGMGKSFQKGVKS